VFDSKQEQGIILHSVQTRILEHTQPPTQFLPKASFQGVQRLRREADHSPPSSDKVKNGGAISPLPHSPSWRGA
jgi:hypothetical protein